MAFDDRSLDSYVDVAQRIADFRELYPHGSLQPADLARPWEIAYVNSIACVQCVGRRSVKTRGNWKTCPRCDGTGVRGEAEGNTDTMIVYTAAAYRTPDDTRPGIGIAWEVYPGRTPYTAGSELQNAETSAWGRAIIAVLASDAKAGVASREEVRNRAAERSAPADIEVDEHGAMTFAEQTRMVTGAVPGTERLDRTPPDDPFLAVDENGQRREPGKLPNPPGPQPPKPSRGYTGIIQAHFKRLGVADRDHRLAATGVLAGRPDAPGSTRDLDPDELKAVAELLSRCRDNGALITLLADREPAKTGAGNGHAPPDPTVPAAGSGQSTGSSTAPPAASPSPTGGTSLPPGEMIPAGTEHVSAPGKQAEARDAGEPGDA